MNHIFNIYIRLFLFLISTFFLLEGCVKENVITLSDEKEILSFSIQGLPITIQREGEILYIVPNEPIDLNEALIPKIIVSEYATITPPSDEPQLFLYTSDIEYVVKAQSGNTKTFYVRIKDISFDCEIQKFDITNLPHRTTTRNDSIFIDIFNDNVSLTDIIPTITVSDKATISPKSNIPQDFSQEVTYTVTSEGGFERSYVVIVKKKLDSGKEIFDFTFPNTTANVVFEDRTITIDIFEEVDLTQLVPQITISSKADISPPSGVAVDFSNPVTYKVTAKDGSSTDYIVKVRKILSYEKELISFTIPNKTANVTITDNFILAEVYDDVDITQLIPQIRISDYAIISPPSGVAVDFSNPVTYKVTAKDGSSADYIVKVKKVLSSEKELISFTIPNKASSIIIENNIIKIEVYEKVDITHLTPLINVSSRASILPKSGQTVDFTNPVWYTITAQDGSKAIYIIEVNKGLSSRNEIEKFELLGTTQQIIEQEGNNISIYVPYETDITNIGTNIVIPSNATINPANGAFTNFTYPQTYTVIASDGKTRDYTITVKKSPWRKIGQGPFRPRDGHTVLVFNDKIWVLGGWIGNDDHVPEVWNSSDGRNWNLITNDAPWKNKKSTNFIVFKEKIYALGGVGNDLGVWASIDGLNWDNVLNEVPWGKRYQPYVAVFRDKIWVFGGLNVGFDQPREYGAEVFSDVWSSEDGVTWIIEKPYLQWPARALVHGYAVLNNELFIYSGGAKGTVNLSGSLETLSEYNDVWKTSDGLNWIRLQASAKWAARTHANIAVSGNKLYLFAGSVGNQSNLSNEVWSSSDGVSWEQVKHSFFPPRHAASAVEFKGKLYLIAGFLINDIWELNL